MPDETPEVNAEAEAPAEVVETPEVDESIADVARRHTTPPEQPVETPEAEEAKPDETPAEETPEAEEAKTPEAEEKPEEVAMTEARAREIYEKGEDDPEYEAALSHLDELGLVTWEDDDETEVPENETPLERQVREQQEWIDAQKEKEQAETEAELLKQNEAAFFSDLDSVFASDGEQFPRDPDAWTETQQLQARLTANMESAEAAEALLQKFADDAAQKLIDAKPEAEEIPNTDGAAAEAKNDNELTPREGIAEVARRHASGVGVQQG